MKTVLHIGLHKTATSFLQTEIFPHIKEIAYYGNKIQGLDLRDCGQKNRLLSNESLSGIPYKSKKYFLQFQNNIEALEDIYKNPSYIIAFREPSSFIGSIYKQYLHEGGTIGFNDFFSLNRTSFLDPQDFYFSKFIRFLEERIPQERLFLYDYSEFKNNRIFILTKLLKFVSADDNIDLKQIEKLVGKRGNRKVNSSVPEKYESTLRTLNKWSETFKKKTGRQLELRIQNRILNPRKICQNILPGVLGRGKEKRDVETIRKFYADDYKTVKQLTNKYLASFQTNNL